MLRRHFLPTIASAIALITPSLPKLRKTKTALGSDVQRSAGSLDALNTIHDALNEHLSAVPYRYGFWQSRLLVNTKPLDLQWPDLSKEQKNRRRMFDKPVNSTTLHFKLSYAIGRLLDAHISSYEPTYSNTPSEIEIIIIDTSRTEDGTVQFATEIIARQTDHKRTAAAVIAAIDRLKANIGQPLPDGKVYACKSIG